MADNRAEERGAERGRGPFFAVKTTVGQEQAVASAIRSRAEAERAGVAAVLAPPQVPGHVFVEGLDFDRLTNLVAAVAHARGVVRAAGGGNQSASQVPWANLEPLLHAAAGTGDAPPIESLLRGDAGAAVTEVRKGRASRAPPPRAAAPPDAEAARAAAVPDPRYKLAVNLVIALPPIALAVGLLVAPAVVWDGFLYPFFWRSIEADARGVGGAAEAYNVVDTVAYALLLVPALLLIWRVLERVRVRVDNRFVLMLTPFLVLGGAGRALEDAVYFREPFVYAFISPLIYVAEGFLVLALVVASTWVASAAATGGTARGVAAWCAAFAPGAAAIFLLGTAQPTFVAAAVPAPIMVSALAAAFLAGVAGVLRATDARPHGFVLIAGGLLLGVVGYLIVRWAALGAWDPAASPVETHLDQGPVILGLAAVATVLTIAGLWLAAPKVGWARNLLLPINGLVYFGQYLDGAATYWGIDHFGYEEKHVVAGFFIEQAGTAFVMFPLKLVVFTFILYLIDVKLRDDLKDADGKPGTLVGLLKLTVIAVGMGPGTRDMLRLVMGV
ncbi:MAG TPA: DUF63 family protein [Candidatus Thermoplasmatota archaeon]